MTVDIDQVALDIARQFVDGGQRKAQLQVAIIEAINRFAKPGSSWKADRAGAAWIVTSPAGDQCEVRDADRSPYAEVTRQLAQSLGNAEIDGEVDVYYQISDMIEPHVQREGINPNGELPASVHDSVQILFNHWLATRNAPVPDLKLRLEHESDRSQMLDDLCTANARSLFRVINPAADDDLIEYEQSEEVTAEAVRLLSQMGRVRERLERRIRQWRSHIPAGPDVPGTRAIQSVDPRHGFSGETDYNNDVALYREGIAVMDEVLAMIDGHGDAAPEVTG